MSPAPKKRSTILVAVGVGVFVVGSGLAALATRGGDDNNASAAEVTTTTMPTGSVAPPAGIGDGFVIPDGHQAIAVKVPFIEGVAGYPKPGSSVNVYSAYKNLPLTAAPEDPIGKLVLQKVKVLSVATAEGGDMTFVLAVSTSEAEALVYLTHNQQVYLTLARDDQGPQTPKGFSDNNA